MNGPANSNVEALRRQKDAAEIAAIAEAARLACEALEPVLESVRVGQRELDVAAALEHELRVRGSEWHPFPTIVASGPRSALPHARTTERTVESGDWLLLDFGAQVDGYCADVTRTVVVGRAADERQRGVVQIKDLVEGKKKAAAIANNQEWREERRRRGSCCGR